MNSHNPVLLREPDGCFLSRPRPVQGELLDGYLYRALRVNEHKSLNGLVDGRSDSIDVKREFLIRHLRLSIEEWERLIDPGYVISQIKGDRKLFLTPHIRWCPQCVEKPPILPGRWLYRTTVVCTQHRAFMRDECPHCHALQKIQRFTGTCYTCGTSLSKLADDDVSEPLIQLQSQLDDALTNGQPNPFLFKLRYHQAAKLVHYLGVLACSAHRGGIQERASSRRVQNDCMLMDAASSIVKKWPDSFITLLALKQADPTTNSVRNDFGNLYSVLYRSLKEEEFQFLRDSFESYVNSHWTGILTKKNRFFSEHTRRSHPRMTINKAAPLMGTTPALLRRKSAELQGREIMFQSGRRLRTIGTTQSSRLKGATLMQAARILHLPERRVRLLLMAGVIQADISPVIFSAAAWFISEERLQALFVRPTGQAKEVGVPLRRVCRYGRLSEAEFIELVKVLISQDLDVVNVSKDPIPLGLAEVRRTDLRRWLLTLRARKGSSVSVDEAAKALGVKQQVAYQLVHRGLLRSYRAPDHADLRVRDVDLKAFQQEYVSLAELARNNKTSPRALLTRMLCSPATGPTVDGGRQYFYRIADLPFCGQDIEFRHSDFDNELR